MSDLEAFFQPYNPLKVSSIKHRDNKYYAFVTFQDKDAASSALESKQGSELFGRRLYIDWAGKTYEPKYRSSQRNIGNLSKLRKADEGQLYQKSHTQKERQFSRPNKRRHQTIFS